MKLIKKGIREPAKIPPFILKKALPNSRWNLGDSVQKKDGIVTFTQGGFAASPSNRSEFGSKIYREAASLTRLLEQHLPVIPAKSSLEIGCGYGRLSPWIAELAIDSYAIEPNEDAVEEAQIQYPEIQFENVPAQNIPFEEGFFDLVVAWTVLQHVPPNTIDAVCEEISRVTKEGGLVLIAESTGEVNGPVSWGRTPSDYENLLKMEVKDTEPKPVERSFNRENTAAEHPEDTLMVFSN